ncbi:hypothetical protein [Brucella sp. BO2]|uniref:hypothetical protein n=1 Tax=Brucella sp. BO2 TaxID=693750 RepID=UPI00046D24E3|nr:hypothetical protein [Brucella sp. BO2]
MFGALSKLAHIAVDTATLPLAAAADIVTLGGELTDREEPYSVTKVKSISENAEKLISPEWD